ncbi:MAG: dephospho-CoA kinase [Clostridiales bacterium]|nr:dephospho-CoA kinase [Clostridiales bacterium]
MLIAITGGIGSGKSEVLKIIKKYAGNVLSADEINRELLKKSDYVKRLLAAFPEAAAGGGVDKKILAGIVFSDGEKRKILNALAHPLIAEIIRDRTALTKGNVFVEIPLITESGTRGMFDKVWVVVSDKNIKTERLKTARGMSEKEIFAVMNAQLDDGAYTENADAVIENNAGKDGLERKVKKLLDGLNT